MRILAIILLLAQGAASAALAQASPAEGASLRQSRIAGDFARSYLMPGRPATA
jgi:hypothetical protein